MVICEIICDSSNKILIKLQTRTEHVIDLPQVDLERNASSERERRSRSREVDLSYLQGFQLHFALKNVNKLLAIN